MDSNPYRYSLREHNTKYCFSATARLHFMPVQCQSSVWHCITSPQGTKNMVTRQLDGRSLWLIGYDQECDETRCRSKSDSSYHLMPLLLNSCLLLTTQLLVTQGIINRNPLASPLKVLCYLPLFFFVHSSPSRPWDCSSVEGDCGHRRSNFVSVHTCDSCLLSTQLPNGRRTEEPYAGKLNPHTIQIEVYNFNFQNVIFCTGVVYTVLKKSNIFVTF